MHMRAAIFAQTYRLLCTKTAPDGGALDEKRIAAMCLALELVRANGHHLSLPS